MTNRTWNMTNRTWIGGGNDEASNPKDWSPTGVPQPGDTLLIDNAGIINISGNALAGDVLSVEPSSTGLEPTFRLDNANVTLAMLNQPPEFDNPNPQNITLNVTGNDSVAGSVDNAKVNLSDNTHLFLSGSMYFINVSGRSNSAIVNDGTMTVAPGVDSSTITADLTGKGVVTTAYPLGITLTIEGAVGPEQTITVNTENTLVLDKPLAFSGTVDAQAIGPDALVIDLKGVTATSYDYSNGVLKLYDGNRVVDDLNLTGPRPPLYVIPTSAGVELSYGEGPVAPPHLPVHS